MKSVIALGGPGPRLLVCALVGPRRLGAQDLLQDGLEEGQAGVDDAQLDLQTAKDEVVDHGVGEVEGVEIEHGLDAQTGEDADSVRHILVLVLRGTKINNKRLKSQPRTGNTHTNPRPSIALIATFFLVFICRVHSVGMGTATMATSMKRFTMAVAR